MNRRAFLSGVCSAAGTAAIAWAQPRTSPDSVFLNGRFLTMNPAQPTAEALAVRGGVIVAIGSQPDIQELAGPRTEVFDLGGRGASPGLIDAHSHLSAFGHMELHFVKLRPPTVHDFASLRDQLVSAARTVPVGQWIVGRGFADFDEGHFPRRQELDEATPDHPVLAIHWTGQYGLANTRALEAAALLRVDVPDPYGGKFLRDPRTGLPDGRLLHYPAIYAVNQPAMSERDAVEASRWGAQRFLEQGVTCVHDNFATADAIRSYVTIERGGGLPLRVRVYPYVSNLEICRTVVARIPRVEGPHLALRGIKLAVDGYPLMYRVPTEHEQANIPMHPQPVFEEIIATIHRAGMQVDVHAAGDRGVDWTLDAFRKASGSDTAVAERRHRIEHYMFHKQDTIGRTAAMGVPVCTQPAWIPMRAREVTARLGAEPVRRMVPLGSFREAGVRVCFGADVPASPTHVPLDSIRSAVSRETPDGFLEDSERVTFAQALASHTIEAAWAAFDEGELGSLERGKRADIAVWNRDLSTVGEGDLESLEVVATYVDGRPTWVASGAS